MIICPSLVRAVRRHRAAAGATRRCLSARLRGRSRGRCEQGDDDCAPPQSVGRVVASELMPVAPELGDSSWLGAERLRGRPRGTKQSAERHKAVGRRVSQDWTVPRWAHNPEVAGSNPAPATNQVSTGQGPDRRRWRSGLLAGWQHGGSRIGACAVCEPGRSWTHWFRFLGHNLRTRFR